MDEQIFLDFKLNFNLCSSKLDRPTLVYAVVYFRGKQYKISTGVKVYPNQWNKRKQIAMVSTGFTKLDNRNNSIVNSKLQEILYRFEQSKLYLCDNVEQIGCLYYILKRYINPNMKDRSVKMKIEEVGTVILSRYAEKKGRGYDGAVSNLKKYLKEKERSDTLENINKKLLEDYQEYLCSTPTKGNVVRTYNTIKDTLMKLRTLLKMAHEDTNITFDYYKNEIDKFKIIQSELSRKEKKSKQVPLTEEQVEILYKLKLSGIEEEVRDVFVCQCLLGQRIGDMPRLFRGDYTIIDNNTVTIPVQKTNEDATIYLFPIAKELLSKYRERGFRHLQIPATEEECKKSRMVDVLNSIIKKICKDAGFDSGVTYKEQRGTEKLTLTKKLYELIHTHIARHTFITIMCNMGIPKETVIIATAHEDTKMIDEVYLHQSAQDNAMKLAAAIEEKARGSIFNTGETFPINKVEHTMNVPIGITFETLLDTQFFASKINKAVELQSQVGHLKDGKLCSYDNEIASLISEIEKFSQSSTSDSDVAKQYVKQLSVGKQSDLHDCFREMIIKCVKIGISKDAIMQFINKALEIGLLDNERFINIKEITTALLDKRNQD